MSKTPLASHIPSSTFWMILGSLDAALAVGFAAATAHLPLHASFTGGVPAIQNAVTQHLVHAVVLLGLGFMMRTANATALRWWWLAALAMLAGTLLFSFNLYARALWGVDDWRTWVPRGGMLLILSWLLVAAGAWSNRQPRP